MKLLVVLLLLMTASVCDAATLAWTDKSNNEQGFIVEKKVGPKWTEIGRPIANSTMFLVKIPPNTYPCFRVRAYNATGKSTPSNVACTPKKGASKKKPGPSNVGE